VRIEEQRIKQFVGTNGQLERVTLADDSSIDLDALFARPPQRQVPIVQSLGLALNPMGYVVIDDGHKQTSIPGIYAAGDLVTPAQGAILAASSAAFAAAMLNHELTIELATKGLLT
jgi:thioredoxin reductase